MKKIYCDKCQNEIDDTVGGNSQGILMKIPSYHIKLEDANYNIHMHVTFNGIDELCGRCALKISKILIANVSNESGVIINDNQNSVQ